MADRVRFVGNSNYISSGFHSTNPHYLGFGTGFPFTPNDDASIPVGPNTSYPIALSLTEAIRWFWCPKRVSISGTYIPAGGTTTSFASSTHNFAQSRELNNCYNYTRVNGGLIVDSAATYPELQNVFVGLFGTIGSTGRYMLKLGDSYYPRIRVDFYDAFDRFAVASAEDFPSYTVPCGSVTFLGETIPMFDGGGTGQSIAATITVDEWWAYSNSNGDPVYDTATGAVLNDPLS